MSKKIKELEELAEFLSIAIARKRESFDQYMKAYDKSTRANATETVQNLLWLLVKQEKQHIAKLREQLHEIKMQIILTRGPRRIKKSIIIKAPPNELYRRSARMARMHAHTMGMAGDIRVELDLKYKNERMAWRTISGDIAMFGTITLNPVDEGTKLTYTINYELPYSILGKVIGKLKIRKDLEKGMTKSLQNLKNRVEKKKS
jgi:uncharacterized membrane protein